MLKVDRNSFIVYTSSVLLDRLLGKAILAEVTEHDEALLHLENGGTIGLTVKGILVSTVTKDQNTEAYFERLLDPQ